MFQLLACLFVAFLDALVSLKRDMTDDSNRVNIFLRYCHQGNRSNRPTENQTTGKQDPRSTVPWDLKKMEQWDNGTTELRDNRNMGHQDNRTKVQRDNEATRQ